MRRDLRLVVGGLVDDVRMGALCASLPSLPSLHRYHLMIANGY